jgi:hypothetical protein
MENRLSRKLIDQFYAINTSNGKDDNIKSDTSTIKIGVVVDTDDPLEQGRLRVWCPDLNDNPKKLHHIPWALYGAPYGGSINNSCYSRGHQTGKEKTSGATHYGFWGIPEQGAHVLVACINGDIRRRVWLGSIPQHQETHTQFTGRFKWEDGNVDGPLSSTNSPIQPMYDNASIAFNDDRASAEWKTRGADYQPTSVREDLGEIPNPSKSTYLDNQYPQISEAEKDDWVKPILGSHGYDWSGHKSLGAFKSSRVYGMSSPGLHSFFMDDRPFNSRIKLKTTAGHQIILDDTNERIYISTYEGKSYIEMDKTGNIDIFADRRLSVHSTKDINIESDETVRIKGKKGLHLYAGDTTGQTPLNSIPTDGQIRLHSTDDMHIMVEKNLRTLVQENHILEIGGDFCTSVGLSMFTQVENDINTISNDGNLNISINGDSNTNVTNNVNQMAGNDMTLQSVNNSEIMAYRGAMDIGAQLDVTVSSKGENVGIESVNKTVTVEGGQGKSFMSVNENSATIYSEPKVVVMSKTKQETTISTEITPSVAKQESTNGCLQVQGVKISYGTEDVDEDVPSERTFKFGNGKSETMDRINSSLETFAENWNGLMQNLNDTFSGILSDPFDFTIPPLFGNIFPITVDLQLPAIELPTLNLPNLCFDFSKLIDISDFNIVPETLFQLNLDMGGWTLDNLKGWVNNIKSNFEAFKSSISLANIASQLQAEITDISLAFDEILNAFNDLIDINILDNGLVLENYSLTLSSLITGMETFNVGAELLGGGLTTIPLQLISKLSGHQENISRMILNSPNNLNGYDFSGLIGTRDEFSTMNDDIFGGI